jgi:hypothetical protein
MGQGQSVNQVNIQAIAADLRSFVAPNKDPLYSQALPSG